MIKNSLYKLIIFSILSSFLSILPLPILNAQIIDNEQAHSSIKWKQINSPDFQLIFPIEFQSSALLLAEQIDSMLIRTSQDLKVKPKKISIILQSNHIEQNGFAQLAPRKVEAFTTPGPASDNTEWLPNLVIHELRHVAQFDKLTGRIQGPFLQQLALAFYGLHLPAWYFEGDAVSIETQYSNGGRGRSSSWMMPYRTNQLSNKKYNLDKNILGSFKDNTAGYYLTGYLLNTYLTNHYGYGIHEEIMRDIRAHLWRPFNLNYALKKTTGLRINKLYKLSQKQLDSTWSSWSNSSISAEAKADKNRFPTDYFLPQTTTAGTLFYLKQSPQTTPALIRKINEKEEKLVNIGFQLTPYYQVKNKFIVWDEIRKDGRFGKQTYNIIQLYNIETGKIQSLSKKSRLYSPILNEKEDKVYSIQVDKNNRSSLIYIDVKSKKIVNLIDFPVNIFIQQPNLNSENNKIIAIAMSGKGTNLIEIDLLNLSWNLLFDWSNFEFNRPIYHKDRIIYKANYEKIDNIFEYNREQKTIHRLTDASFGAFYPSVNGDENLLYNDYQYNGYKVNSIGLDQDNKPVFKPNLSSLKLIDEQLKEFNPPLSRGKDKAYEVTNYNSLSHLFNFHSLSISANNFENFDNYKPSIYWLSNDLLNTTQLKLGYEYDLEMEKSNYSAEISYNKFFPKFTLKYLNRGQIGQAKVGNSNQIIGFDFRENVYSFDMQIPISIYRGNLLYSYGLSFGTSYQQRYDLSISTLRNFNYEFSFPLNYLVYFNRNTRRSQLDLIPKWGQNINFTYRHVPFEDAADGQMFVLKSNFYFPGIFHNHGFQARFSYQSSTGRYEGMYEIPLVSGFSSFNAGKFNNTLLLNYRFPIAYPDWAISSIAYIKRFHGYFFADYQDIQRKTMAPVSFGIGLSADFNLFRYILPDFGIGTKFSYINHPSAKGKIVPSFSFNYSY
ncbi:hypothetical protein ACFRAE_01995 [Sphingobacterium sp. HJSM2_6]|uniref:hypothetical protein n=1 Tax=Sphingobacterium sp. HJSM2_6 TaxID=3366264 RepID=UPI003BE6F306